MRFEILGPLRIVDGDEFRLTAQKAEILLATLLLRVDCVVTTTQLQAELWAQDPPYRPSAGVHVYVSRLRKFLTRPSGSASAIVTRPPGYLLQIGSDEVDLDLFQTAVRRGRRQLQAGSALEAAASFETALGFWRGAPLGGLRGGPIVGGFAALAEESRLECFEMLMEAYFMLGRHRESVSTLFSLTAEYPLREAFYALLMLALYRTNRQAEALLVYQGARATLIERLGVEPSRALRELLQAIRSEAEALDVHPGSLHLIHSR